MCNCSRVIPMAFHPDDGSKIENTYKCNSSNKCGVMSLKAKFVINQLVKLQKGMFTSPFLMLEKLSYKMEL